MLDLSKGACDAGSMGMNVPHPQPKRKARTNCVLLSGGTYLSEKGFIHGMVIKSNF